MICILIRTYADLTFLVCLRYTVCFSYLCVLSSVFICFSSWGNLPLQSYWRSLSCDHGLHCTHDLMWEQRQQQQRILGVLLMSSGRKNWLMWRQQHDRVPGTGCTGYRTLQFVSYLYIGTRTPVTLRMINVHTIRTYVRDIGWASVSGLSVFEIYDFMR